MLGNEYADIIRAPNNLLAVEYVKAIRDIGSSLIPKTIIRSGVAHDSQTLTKTMPLHHLYAL